MRLQSTKLPNHQIIVAILLFKWGKKSAIQKNTDLAKSSSFIQPNQDIPQFSYNAKSILGLNLK